MSDDQPGGDGEGGGDGRRPYTTPHVITVPLKPQEAVLGFCKTLSASAGVGSPVDCTTCASPGS